MILCYEINYPTLYTSTALTISPLIDQSIDKLAFTLLHFYKEADVNTPSTTKAVYEDEL